MIVSHFVLDYILNNFNYYYVYNHYFVVGIVVVKPPLVMPVTVSECLDSALPLLAVSANAYHSLCDNNEWLRQLGIPDIHMGKSDLGPGFWLLPQRSPGSFQELGSESVHAGFLSAFQISESLITVISTFSLMIYFISQHVLMRLWLLCLPEMVSQSSFNRLLRNTASQSKVILPIFFFWHIKFYSPSYNLVITSFKI